MKKRKGKEIRTPRAHPTHTTPEEAGAGHAHWSFNESWDHTLRPQLGSYNRPNGPAQEQGAERPQAQPQEQGITLTLHAEVNGIL